MYLQSSSVFFFWPGFEPGTFLITYNYLPLEPTCSIFFFETLVPTCQTTGCHDPKHDSMILRCLGNLKFILNLVVCLK